MKTNILAIYSGITLFLFLALSYSAARADSACNFSTGIETIAALNKEGGGEAPYTIPSAEELNLRRETLTKVINCAADEAEKFRTSLETISLPTDDLEIKSIHRQLVNRMEEALDYYAIAAANAKKSTNIEENKKIAKAVLEWRNTEYAPVAEKTLNFILWFKNKDLISIAERRLSQTEQDIKYLNLQNNQDISRLIDNSRWNIGYAIASNRRARETFIGTKPPEDFPYLLKSSLESLALSYQHFFEIGAIVKKIIPK